MTALTREELLDIDPAGPRMETDVVRPREIALRHAWDWAVEAETESSDRDAQCAAISQAWSAIAEVLK